jgi:nucleotide-binding universal stress UspA family protein
LYRTILLPLDGSRFAEQALPAARAIARRTGAELRLAVVHQPLPAWAQRAVPEGAEAQARESEQAYLTGVEADLRKDGIARVGTVLLQSPPGHGFAESAVRQGFTSHLLNRPTGQALAEYIQSSGVDLVVMATHGRGAMSRFWLGSVADYLLRHLEIPLLLIRPLEGRPLPPFEPRRVLIPVDRSESSLHAVEATRGLGGEPSLEIVHVVESVIPVGGAGIFYPAGTDLQLNEQIQHDAEDYLNRTVAGLRGQGLTVEGRAIPGADAARTILDLLEQGGIDLIAMTTHGEGGLRPFLLGSVTDKIIRGSGVPVLVWRPPEPPGR